MEANSKGKTGYQYFVLGNIDRKTGQSNVNLSEQRKIATILSGLGILKSDLPKDLHRWVGPIYELKLGVVTIGSETDTPREIDLDAFLEENPDWRCPVSLSRLVDPVILPCGNTMSRKVLETWLSKNNTSPLTGGRLQKNRWMRGLRRIQM